MRKIVLSIAAGIMCLGLTSAAADARDVHHGRPVAVRGHVVAPNHVVHTGPAYFHDHAVRFSGGYYYRGFDHNHWARRVWDPVHRRYQFWDSGLNTYFYWYAPGNCYYPVTYCP
jgi:hypothetical protein